jgi:hypothetical protein
MRGRDRRGPARRIERRVEVDARTIGEIDLGLEIDARSVSQLDAESNSTRKR